jgi:hypothetical protein
VGQTLPTGPERDARFGSLPIGLPWANGRYLRISAGWSRREADITDPGLGRLNWADSGRSIMNLVRVANKRMPMEQTLYPFGLSHEAARLSGRMRTARHAPAKNAPRSGRPSGGEGVTVTRCQDFQHSESKLTLPTSLSHSSRSSQDHFDLGTHLLTSDVGRHECR